MSRIISALILVLGVSTVFISSQSMAGENCIYGKSLKATDTETTTDETPKTVIVPRIETEGDAT